MVSVEKSHELHQSVKAKLLTNPEIVISRALSNICQWEKSMGFSSFWYTKWHSILKEGVDSIVAVLDGMDEQSIDLRANSPFTGILTDEERLNILFGNEDERDAMAYLASKISNARKSIEQSSNLIDEIGITLENTEKRVQRVEDLVSGLSPDDVISTDEDRE